MLRPQGSEPVGGNRVFKIDDARIAFGGSAEVPTQDVLPRPFHENANARRVGRFVPLGFNPLPFRKSAVSFGRPANEIAEARTLGELREEVVDERAKIAAALDSLQTGG